MRRFLRGLAAILTTLMVVGCGPQSQPFPTQTPEEIKQLTAVTDAVVHLVGNSNPDEALPQAVAALTAASKIYRVHKEAILTTTNSDVLACISAHTNEILDLETMLARRDEAAGRQDEEMVKRRTMLLWSLAWDMDGCAAMSIELLINMEKRPAALQHGAIAISEIYSTAMITRAAIGLKVEPLLADQIRAYERVLQGLGPEQKAPFINDALPKLKAALAQTRSSVPQQGAVGAGLPPTPHIHLAEST
jgi:hypothetical protein